MRNVDLRSDSVTQATPEMRRAMAEAAVGDDGREGDPTTQRLERLSAEMTGHGAALFVHVGDDGESGRADDALEAGGGGDRGARRGISCDSRRAGWRP